MAISILICAFSLQACGGGGEDPAPNDDGGGDDPQSLSLNSIGNKSVLAGETLSFTLSANDPNGTTRTYMADGTNNVNNPLLLTDRVSFNESSGEFVWNTIVNDEGNYNIEFSVTNDTSPPETDRESIAISVEDPVAYGQRIFVPSCGSCHGSDGLGGSVGIIGAPTADEMEQAFQQSQNSTMRSYIGYFSAAERNAMYLYLCTFPDNALACP